MAAGIARGIASAAGCTQRGMQRHFGSLLSCAATARGRLELQGGCSGQGVGKSAAASTRSIVNLMYNSLTLSGHADGGNICFREVCSDTRGRLCP